jgi:crotonobetainyl-CoA:carnitine CoA-transferase CaiB-like acyl-CoA transferase
MLTKKEIAEEGRKRGINAAVVNDPSDVLANPQLEARDFWAELQHPGFTAPLRLPRYLFLSSETQNFVRRRAPMIGEHNREIYNQELGLSREEITALEVANVL